ncbi:MAG: FmdB family zinc ribbon protein [Pseudomonadota bacterium]
MPIYEYLCSSCGARKDVLQRISDATLTVCPECGLATFNKQLSAAGFQLKGSGWYATDFKGGGSKPEVKAEAKTEAKTEAAVSAPVAPASSDT